jgi:putative addiction module component (TIGR02574 family)
MSDRGLRLIEEALAIPVNERADLVERLLSSLDPVEPEIEKHWAKEVEDRIDALERDDLRTISAEEFFRPFRKPVY